MARFTTYLLCAAIIATLAGGIGGSFQPARLLLIASAALVLALSRVRVETAPVARQALMTLAVMLLAGGISLSWTMDPLGGFGMMLAVAMGGLSLYIVTRSDLSYHGVRLLMWSWVAAVGLSIPVAFYEIATGNHFAFALEDRQIGGLQGITEFPFASIFFGNYNDYSTWLCLAFSITMGTFLETRNFLYKLGLIALNLTVVAIVFVNTSRASMAFCVFVFIVYFVVSKKFRNFAALPVALLAVGLLAKYQGQILDLYDLATYRFAALGSGDESYVQRSGLLTNGIRAMIESYGVGLGAGSFEEYMAQNYPYYIPNPHNIFLEIGVNFGVIPLLLFVLLLGRLFWVGFFRRDLPLGFRMAIMMGVASVPIVGAVPSQAIGYVYWWVWLATMIALASARAPDGASPSRDAGLDGDRAIGQQAQ